MSRSDSEFGKQDQAEWWDDYRQDQDAMQQAQEDALRKKIMDEIEKEFVPQVADLARRLAAKAFRVGFLFGFLTALTGAVVFIYFR